MPVTYGNQTVVGVPSNSQHVCPISVNSKWVNIIEAGGGTAHNSGTHVVNPAKTIVGTEFNFMNVAGATYLFVRSKHTGGSAGTNAVIQMFGFDGTGTASNFFSLVNSNDADEVTLTRNSKDNYDGTSYYTIPTSTYQFDLKGAVGALACVMTKFDSGTAADTTGWILQAKAI